jgi:RimJ/RimL family protein N-acetyltransferase
VCRYAVAGPTEASTVPSMTSNATIRLVLASNGWAITDGVLTLRPLTVADVPEVTAALSNQQSRLMLAHWIDLEPLTVPERQNKITSKLLGGWSTARDPFAVLDDRGVVIGVRWLSGRGCGGWIHTRWRGCGYGSRALRLQLHFAARMRGLDRIITGTRCDNLPAQRNLAACGFIHTGFSERPRWQKRTSDRIPDQLQRWEIDVATLAALGPIPAGEPARRQRRRPLRRVHTAAAA